MGNSSSKKKKTNRICNPQLTDVFAVKMIPFLENPAPLRGACKFFRDCWDQGRYLEVAENGCPYIVTEEFPTTVSSDSGVSTTTEKVVNKSLPITWAALQACSGMGLEFKLRNWQGLTELFLIDLPGVTAISDQRIHLPPSVTKITMKRLNNLENIGSDFLAHLDSLEEVTVEELPKLKAVGHSWMRGCKKIKKLRIANLPELRTVGDDWINYCVELEYLSLEGLPALRCVGDGWLCSAQGLKTVAITDFPCLQKIGRECLRDSPNLETVSFERLPALNAIGGGWLGGATMLRTLRLSGLPQLRDPGIKTSCMRECYCLKGIEIDAPSCHEGMVSACQKV